MTCLTVPPYFVSPQLDTKAVQELQQLFVTELSAWLQLCYPLTRVGKTKDADGNVYSYPQCYKNNGSQDYYDIRPNDSLQSYGFFELNDKIVLDDDTMKYNLSFVCWYNLNTVDVSRTEDYTRELAKDVLRAINTDEVYKYSVNDIEIDFNPESIFDKYSFSPDDLGYLMYPYGAFKITFNVEANIVNDCTALTIVGGTGCSGSQKTPCELLIASLTASQLNTCILPNYNFSDSSTYSNFTAAQIAALTALYGGGGGSPAIVRNSDSSYSTTVVCGGTLVLPNETISVYVNGILNQSGTYIPLDTTAINITV